MMMGKKVGIIGFGDLGNQLFGYLLEAGLYKSSDFVFFDDIATSHHKASCVPFNNYLLEEFSGLEFYIGLGYKHLKTRESVINSLITKKCRINTFIHASSFVHPSASVHEGCIVFPMCNIDRDVVIGKGTILNNSVVISHNCSVGLCNFFAPGVVLSGNVKTGQHCFLGSGCIIANNITIHDDVMACIGSVITKDFAEAAYIGGNPAQIIKNGFKLF